MSHYLLEVVMPPTPEDKIEDALNGILNPFMEDPPKEDEEEHRQAFWDWWQIGGRYSGSKVGARVGQSKMDSFCKELARLKVTVSSFQFGKQELRPSSQQGIVDALWREWFPDTGLERCPLFKHSDGQEMGDICRFDQIPEGYKAYRVIFAPPSPVHHDDGPMTMDGPPRGSFMLARSLWNGLTWQNTAWDGSFAGAVEKYRANYAGSEPSYRAAVEPKPDWTCVTVDYHN